MTLKPYFEENGITLYHGDCREVLPELPSETIDMALTDPPYLVSYRGRWDAPHAPILGDSESDWVAPVFGELWRILKADSLCLSFYGWPHADIFLSTWKASGFRPVSLIVLVKDRLGLGQFTRAQHEQAYLLAKGTPRRPELAPPDVFDWHSPLPRLHPNQKPISPTAKLLSAYTMPGQCVVDPFCGSGTTLIAARLEGRRAIGIEIDERFCEATALRLSQGLLDFSPKIRADALATRDCSRF